MENQYTAIPLIEGVYRAEKNPECEFAYLTEAGFRVMARSMAQGCPQGKFRNEEAVTLYGYRVRDPADGRKGIIITDVVESSPASYRSPAHFEEDYEYAIQRDVYLRDGHANKNWGVLGAVHMHPPMCHFFSRTDLESFDMYLEDQKLYFCGLFNLEEGVLRLKMWVCQRDPLRPGRLYLHDLPTAVSDAEVYSRMPPEKTRDFNQIWEEVAHSAAPRFMIADPLPSETLNEAPKTPEALEAPKAPEAMEASHACS